MLLQPGRKLVPATKRETTEDCNKCPIVVCGQALYTDFFILEIPSFDAVFGMDWPSTSFATIYCHGQMVVFQVPNRPKFKFRYGQRSLDPAVFRARPMEHVFTAMSDSLISSRSSLVYFLTRIVDFLQHELSSS